MPAQIAIDSELNRLLRSEAFLYAVLFTVHHHVCRCTIDYYELAPSQINRTNEHYLMELLYQHYGPITDQYAVQQATVAEEEDGEGNEHDNDDRL